MNKTRQPWQKVFTVFHMVEQSKPGMVEIPAGDVLSSATKALPLQPSDATVPLVDISGRHQTPTEMLQLPCYDKSQPTLLGIPKEIRLQILKLALPHTTEVVVCTDIDPRGKHFLEYRALQSPTVIPWGTATQDNFVPGSPLPSFLRTSKQLYDEGSELMEGFKTYILNGRPAHFERYPAVLQKHTKTIYFAPWAICADYAFLHANFPQLREIEFFVPLPEMPDYMQVTLTEQAAVASAASATEAPGAASYLYLESPIPNPDESDFTQRILPRFQYQGQHFCDRFYDAVYKNNIKITWDSFVGQFEPSRTGSTHKVAKFMAVAVCSPDYEDGRRLILAEIYLE